MGDKGTGYTCREFREYCLLIGVKLEFASPNNPQQIGAYERAGRAVAAMVRCLLTESGLRISVGEADADRGVPEKQSPRHSTREHYAVQGLVRQGRQPRIPSIGAREFHVEMHTRKLDPKVWEGRLRGYSIDNSSFRIYNPEEGNVREIRSVIFTETPSTIPDSTPRRGAEDDGSGYQSGSRPRDNMRLVTKTPTILCGMLYYTSLLDLDSPTSNLSAIPSVSDSNDTQQLVSNIEELTSQDVLTSNNEITPPSGGSEQQESQQRRNNPHILLLTSLDAPCAQTHEYLIDLGTRSTTNVGKPSLTSQRARETTVIA